MANININFNDKNYSIDEASLSAATAALQSHLSTVMNGSGAVINLGEISYSVDSAKLATATNAFVTHLGTVAGSASNTITWDGNAEGLQTASLYSPLVGTDVPYIKVHDKYFSVADVDSIVMIIEGNAESMPLDIITEADFGWQCGVTMLCVSNPEGMDGFSEGLWIPDASMMPVGGLTITLKSSNSPTITVNGVEHPIDFSKLAGAVAELETVFGGLNSSGGSDTLTWDGNTEGLEDFAGNSAYKVTTVAPTVEDFANGGTVKISTNGQEMDVAFTADDVSDMGVYIQVFIDGSGMVFVVPSDISDGGMTLRTGLYLASAKVGENSVFIKSITINGYNGF